ncbi:hypothetical protein Vadar_007830 [Vaccinium darrowii]|uniref:Uncharacterized protein n=1 Tax=Vaccinium darrowii TaxID=229202 RepID=A0ACB7YCK4_9ERIC|nr:hypothetical protein Vadar_007830 [Vaccinium darrowii]
MVTELPTIILELNDLKILDVRACHNLEAIPDKIGLLKKLRHLDVPECYLLEHMPKSLAQLSNLEVLKRFLIGDFKNKQSCTLYDLSRLRYLRKLNIYVSVKNLLRVRDLEDLERFVGLQKLTISCRGCSLKAQTEAFHFATLPPRMQKLDLQGFPITSLPNCLMPGKLTKLKKLYIRGEKLCDIGQIRKHQGEQCTVEILRLKYLSELETDLKELRILFPKLIYLHQVECPKFRNIACDYRGVWMDNNAIDCGDLEDLERFVGLQKLTISCRGSSLKAQTEAFHFAILPPRMQKLDLQGRQLVNNLAKESGKTHEELSTELKLQHKEACTTVHERLLIDNTRDYGTYDPTPAFNKPAFKLIPN